MHAYALDPIPDWDNTSTLHNCQMQLDDDLLVEPSGAPLAFVFEGTCTPIGHKTSQGSKIQPIQTRMMGDSGASARFISLAFVEKHNLPVKKTHHHWSVKVANNESVLIQGSVDLEINIQGYNDKIKFLVMPMTQDYDIILGNDWFLKRQVDLSYGKMTATIHQKGKTYILRPTTVRRSAKRTVQHPSRDNADTTDATNPDTFVLNSAQARRALRKRPDDMKPVWVGHVDGSETWSEENFLEAMATKAVPAEVQEEAVRKAIQDLQEQVAASNPPPPPPDGRPPDPEYDRWSKWLDNRITELILKYGDSVFRETIPGIRQHGEPVEAIPTPDGAKPPARGLGRYSKQDKEELDKQIKELLAQGLIEPSLSPYAAAALIVPKYNPDGSIKGWRMVIDYRLLNAITVKYQYPMPRIDDVLDSVNGARFFSSCDATWGFWQLRLHPNDIKKTAFRTPSGLYQWRVLPFGLSNSPAVFQRTMASFFQRNFTNPDGTTVTALGSFVQIYLDDILIYSKTAEEHARHLDFVFSTLRENGIYLNPKKCEFNKAEVRFLGHLVSKDGVRPDPAKVEVMKQWPVPTDRHELYRFLGFANYFRVFIRDYATIASPLYPLTQISSKDEFAGKWTQLEQDCFEAIKTALANAPTLKLPDFDIPFEVLVDASNIAVGAVLIQELRPCAYESKKLSAAERKWTTTERELYAAVHALKVWECYLRHPSLPFTLWTDHNPNTFFSTNTRPLTQRQARWQDFIAPFNFEWKYKKGEENIADALSRLPDKAYTAIEEALSHIHLNELVCNGIETRTQKERRLRQETRSHPEEPSATPAQQPSQLTQSQPLANELAPRTPLLQPPPIAPPVNSREPTSQPTQTTIDLTTDPPADGEPAAAPMVEPILITPERPAKRRHTGTNVSFADNQQTPVNMGQPREKSAPSTNPAPVEQEPPASTTGNTQTTEPAGTAEQNTPETLPEETDAASQKSKPSYKMTPFEKLLWAERNHPWYQRYAKKKNWHQDDNQLWRTASNKLVIPPKDSIRDQVMEACHDSVFSGHFSHPRTLHLVERLFYWPEMSRDIEKFCRSCTVCGEVKSYNRAKQGASLPHPVPVGKWSDVTCDMIVDLPTTARGNNAILLFVDKCTKMTHAVATSKELNSQEFCFLFNKDVVRLHGAPNRLITDRGSIFFSKFTKNHTARMGCWQCFGTAFHPESDGQSERHNRVAEDVLRCFCSTNQAEWDTYLPMVEFAMNNAYSEVTRATPFLLNYGVHPRHPTIAKLVKLQCNGVTLSNPGQRHTAQHARAAIAHTLRTIPDVPESIKFTKAMQRAIEHTRLLLHAARQRMMDQVNKRRTTETVYKEGVRVWLSTKYIRLQHEGCNKLMPRYCGPFKVIKHINPVAIKLELPKVMKVHPVFHVSLLKPFVQRAGTEVQPRPIIINGTEEFEVEKLLGRREKVTRTKKTKHAGKKETTRVEYLVKWKGYGAAHNEWVPEAELQRNCKKLLDKFHRR
jgi:hypothetical protein